MRRIDPATLSWIFVAVASVCAVILWGSIAWGVSRAIQSVGAGIAERTETALTAPWWAYLPVVGWFYDWNSSTTDATSTTDTGGA